MDTISLVLIFTVINSFMVSFTLGFVLSKVSKPDKNNSGTSDNPDPVLTDEQLKVFYEADKKQTEAFNATLQSLHNFMTGEEIEEVKKQND